MDILADLGDARVMRAAPEHVSTIERLLADDPTSAQHVATTTLISDDLLGEAPADVDLMAVYEAIAADPNQEILVVIDDDDRVIGTLQLTFCPTLARGGGVRAFVAAARVRAGQDSVAIAKRVLGWAVSHARERGARVLIVLPDKNRAHMHGFFTTMGFRPSHDGLVLPL